MDQFFVAQCIPANTWRTCHEKQKASAFDTKRPESNPDISTSYADVMVQQHVACTQEMKNPLLVKAEELVRKNISFTGYLRFALLLAIEKNFLVTSKLTRIWNNDWNYRQTESSFRENSESKRSVGTSIGLAWQWIGWKKRNRSLPERINVPVQKNCLLSKTYFVTLRSDSASQ